MSDLSQQRRLLGRAERAFAKTSLAQLLESRRQIIGPRPDQMIAAAKAAREALLEGKLPTPSQQVALERAIRLQRPAPCCVAGAVTPLGDVGSPFDERWTEFQPILQQMQGSVGRLDRIDSAGALGKNRQALGTGFLVAPDLILTARHVVEKMTYDTMRLEPGQAIVDFGAYLNSNAGEEREITSVVAVDRHHDLGLLRIKPVDAVQPLAIEGLALNVGDAICVVGYPLRDERSEAVNVDFVFQNRFKVKRAAVGEVIRSDAHFHFHDASTLGGNSGSPVIDLTSGKVCGVHVSGRALARNVMIQSVHVLDFIERSFHVEPNGQSAPVTSVPVGIDLSAPLADRTADDAEFDHIDEVEARPEDYVDRKGYDAHFLGVEVPLPKLTRNQEDILKYESDGEEVGVLQYQHFSVVMSKSLRMCRYSACNINGAKSKKRKRKGWRFDPRIPKDFQIMKECYGREPKFSRGHMTRREDPVWGADQDASTGNVDSMHVTNAVPQIQPFNAGIWLRLEDYALDNSREDDMRISVFTGAFFTDEDPVRFGVPIPLKFWKVIAFIHDQTEKLTATGYTMSQEPFLGESEFVFGQHQNRQRPISEIERKAGIKFGPLAGLDPMRDVPESTDRLLTNPSQIRFL